MCTPCCVALLQESWRKPRGIDGRVRRQYRGAIPLVRIGYGSNKKTRGLLPNGFKKFVVHNVKVCRRAVLCCRVYLFAHVLLSVCILSFVVCC